MYGSIKKVSEIENALKDEALKLIQMVSLDPTFDSNDRGEVDFEAIHKAVYSVIDEVMAEVVNPKMVLPTKADLLKTLRNLELN